MVFERLALHHKLVTKVDELWCLLEDSWAAVPEHPIHSMHKSMARRITIIIVAGGGCSKY